MCNACELLFELQSLNCKAVIRVLFKISKQLKDSLAYRAQHWQLTATKELEKVIEACYRSVPVAEIRLLLEQTKIEIRQIEKLLLRHIAMHIPKESEWLKAKMEDTAFAPSESANMVVKMTIEFEKGEDSEDDRTLGIKEDLKDDQSFGIQNHESTDEELAFWTYTAELDSSEPGPDISQNTWLTKSLDDWFHTCNQMTLEKEGDDEKSFVSVMGGGVMERPALDVAPWKRTEVQRISRTRTKRQTRRERRQSQKVLPDQDLVYEKPRNDVAFDDKAIRRAGLVVAPMKQKQQAIFKTAFQKVIFASKPKYPLNTTKISKNQTKEVSKNEEEGHDQAQTMSGCRSMGHSLLPEFGIAEAQSNKGTSGLSTTKQGKEQGDLLSVKREFDTAASGGESNAVSKIDRPMLKLKQVHFSKSIAGGSSEDQQGQAEWGQSKAELCPAQMASASDKVTPIMSFKEHMKARGLTVRDMFEYPNSRSSTTANTLRHRRASRRAQEALLDHSSSGE